MAAGPSRTGPAVSLCVPVPCVPERLAREQPAVQRAAWPLSMQAGVPEAPG